MFDELEEESVDVTPDSPDRAIAWAIWSRSEDANLTPEEAWAILHERYPDEPRFLLLNSYTELSETRKQSEGRLKAARVVVPGVAKTTGPTAEVGVWTPAYFLKKVERVLAHATDALYPQVRDLLVFGGAVLAGATVEDAKMLAEVRAKIGAEPEEPKRDDRDRAGLRLRRFEREVLKELDERTQDGKPLGVRAPVPPAAAPGNDWADAVADTSKPRRRYAASERFERGELVEHPKFGVGVVTGTEAGKAIILFESGSRKLVAGA
jgi:hypothetical protein